MLLWKRRAQPPEVRRACEVEVRQLLHRLVRPRRMRPLAGAGGQGPPTLHAWAAFHKSASSSPTGGGLGPRRLSSLPCFLLTKQKTCVKTQRNAGTALNQGFPRPHTTWDGRYLLNFF